MGKVVLQLEVRELLQNLKKNNILPLGLSDGLIVKKDIEKNELITLDMVDCNFSEDVIAASINTFNILNFCS